MALKKAGKASCWLSRIGIVIPVYQSLGYLPGLVKEITGALETLNEVECHVVIVDDGSSPPLKFSWPQTHWLQVTLLRHAGNFGKGQALKTGFSWLLQNTLAEAVVTMDGDGQHPPGYIPRLVTCFQEGGYDLVIGYRKRIPGRMPFHRIISNTLTSLFISLLIGEPVRDSQCGFRLYDRRLLETLPLREQRFHLESEALILAGWRRSRIGWVPIPTIYNGAPSAIRNLPDTLNFIQLIFKLLRERTSGRIR
ncbi:MAG: glycosyltransferase family 2 protein [Calditrichaeota bacterium]|nr:MAG: glycosyltransferase family 2 protein [Calditrichota bacterium]